MNLRNDSRRCSKRSVSDGKVCLFIDEMHLLMGAGKFDGAMDAANLLKPLLARGKLRCIGATTLDEHRQYVEKDRAFERRFQKVMVEEPSVPDAVSILRGLKSKYEAHHGVRLKDAALVAAVQLSDRYITQRFLPDKAIDLIDEACSKTRVQLDSRPEQIDTLERRKLQLEIEASAMEREKDDRASKLRLRDVRKELADIEDALSPLVARWRRAADCRAVEGGKGKAQQTLPRASSPPRRGHCEGSDVEYFAIPEVQARIERLSKQIDEEKARSAEDANKIKKMLVETVELSNCERCRFLDRIPADKLGQHNWNDVGDVK